MKTPQSYKRTIIFVFLVTVFFIIAHVYKAFGVNEIADDNNKENDTSLGVGELTEELTTRRNEIEELKKQADVYRKKLIDERNQALNLKNQLTILDTESAKLSVEIKAKEQEIAITQIDIEETGEKILLTENHIAQLKDQIAEILRTISQNDTRSYLEILLINDSLSEFFNEVKSIENLHDGLHKKLVELKNLKNALESERLTQVQKKQTLEKQKGELENVRERLADQQAVKEQLLLETQSSEQKFNILLKQLKADENAVDAEIVELERTIRIKLEEQENAKQFQSQQSKGFVWPVTKNRITAYFHDPSYPYRYVFEHPAIDIRAAQRTTVSAAASGYVAKARKDEKCTGLYSYVMIIHPDGFSTVYGHVNQIDVNEGDFVVQGERIALSGGMPGTCGAGRLTTGPHMHFEIRLNGIPVDPLEYLP